MKFLSDCAFLKIEDILPFFPDFVTIDQFKVSHQDVSMVMTSCITKLLLSAALQDYNPVSPDLACHTVWYNRVYFMSVDPVICVLVGLWRYWSTSFGY